MDGILIKLDKWDNRSRVGYYILSQKAEKCKLLIAD